MANISSQTPRRAKAGAAPVQAQVKPNVLNSLQAWADRNRTLVWALGLGVIAVATLIAYWPAVRAGFIWDDDWLLTQNPRMLSWYGLGRFWWSMEQPDYLPITWTSFWVGCKLWGNAPLGHHLTNVVLHIGCAGLLWLFLRRLAVPGAWAAALLFALHPVNVASTAWVAERKNQLVMVFFLLTLLTYLRHLRGGSWRWLAGSVALYLAALLSKSSVVMAPLVVLGLTWFVRGALTRRDWLKAIPFAVLSAGAAAMTVYTQTVRVIQTETVFAPDESIFWRLAGWGVSVWFYLSKVFWPAKLAMIYPRWKIDPVIITEYLPLLAVIAMLAGLAWYRNRRYVRPAFAAMGYYVLMLVPVMGVFRMFYMRFALAADHWQHLSIAAPIALVVGAMWWGASRLGTHARAAAAVLTVVVAAALGTATYRQCTTYQDQTTLWRDNLRKYDQAWMAWFSLGNALSDQYEASKNPNPRALEEAMRCYQRSVELKPDFTMARNNLGNLLAKQGKFEQALMLYTQAMAFRRGEARVLNNRGAMLWRLGRYSEAMHAVQMSLDAQPDYGQARMNMSEFLAAVGRPDEGMEVLREGIRLDRYNVDFRVKLGAMFARAGRTDEGISELRTVIQEYPEHPVALENLGMILAEKGRYTEAIELYDRAVEAPKPRPELLLGRGWALQHLDRPAEAALSYEQALEVDPNMLGALKALAWMRATHPQAAIRNGQQAMELATRLNELTQYSLGDALGVLAAAQAELGNFEQACQINQRAIDAARRSNIPTLAGELEQFNARYAASQPARQETLTEPPAFGSGGTRPSTAPALPG